MIRLLIIPFLLFNQLAFAAGKVETKWFDLKNASFGFGSYVEFYNKLQIDAQGNKNDFVFNPYLSIGAEAKTFYDLYFYPEFVFVLPDGGDYDKMTKTTLIFNFDLGKRFFNDSLIAAVGTGIVMNIYNGKGGTISMQNGDSQSDQFFAPDESRMSINNTFNMSLSYFILSTDTNIKLETLVFSLFDSERTMISYTLSVNYFWDGVLQMDFLK